jgi:alpha-L-rhamnosidase
MNSGSPPSPSEQPVTWDLALRHPVAWHGAEWIGLPLEHFFRSEPAELTDIPRGQWIGNNEKSRFYVRRAFALPENRTIKSARLRIEADNRFDLWINGGQVPLPPSPGSWRNLAPLDISPLLKAGDNLLCLRAWETDSPDWFISALRGGLRIDFADGDEPRLLETDAAWQATEVTWPKVFLEQAFTEDQWLQPGFADHAPPDICQELHPRHTRRSWLGRKIFQVHRPVRRALVYATARGLYELSLNGQRIGRDLLTPHHLPADRYQYQAYDITPLLRPGDNCLGVLTGGGFFNTIGHSGLTAGAPLFLAQLEWQDDEGRKHTVASDASWRVSPSPLLEDSPQYGVRHDARLEQPGWNEPAFDDSHWAPAWTEEIPAHLEPQECETVQVVRETTGRLLPGTVAGRQVFDFGTNSSGRVRLTIRDAAAGERIVIRYGELLADDGGVFHGPYRNVIYPEDEHARFMMRNIDTYICRGDAQEVFAPRFCYTGFRYAQVESYPGELASADFLKVEFHNALPERGTFASADPLLDGLFAMARNSWTSNLHGAPTDCPTREKQHWEDIGVQVGRTALWLAEAERLLARWMTKGQRLGGTVGWEDMDIELPWEIHLFTGDTALLRTHWPVMQALVEKRLALLDNGLYSGRERHQWLDHTALEATEHEIFCSAFLWRNLDLMQKMSDRLEKDADADRYRRRRDELGAAIHARLYDPATGRYANGTQTAQLLPLAFGLTPHDRRGKVFEALVADLQKRGGALSTGMTGTRFLLPVLSAHGRHDLALQQALKTDFPSWGHWLSQGATTMAETWDAWDLPQDKLRLRSFNHPNYASIGQWFFESLGGLQPDEDQPGFRHFHVRPQVEGPLPHVTVTFRSVRGWIRSAWRKAGGRLEMRVEVPADSTATIRVPGSGVTADPGADAVRTRPRATDFHAGPGLHTFTAELP